jgi:hypothetical protein
MTPSRNILVLGVIELIANAVVLTGDFLGWYNRNFSMIRKNYT